MDDYSRSFDEAMSENVQKVSRGLDAQCVEVIRHFEDEKDERAELLSNMYSELLGKFLVDTEVTANIANYIFVIVIVICPLQLNIDSSYAFLLHAAIGIQIHQPVHINVTQVSWRKCRRCVGPQDTSCSSWLLEGTEMLLRNVSNQILSFSTICKLCLQTEIDSTVREVLQAQQCGREQEGRLDALLLKALDESKVSIVNNYACKMPA